MAITEYHGWFEGVGDLGFVSDPTNLFQNGSLLQAIGIKVMDPNSYFVDYTINANDGGFYGFASNGEFVGNKDAGKFITAVVINFSVNGGISNLFKSLPNLTCQVKPRGGDWQSTQVSDMGKRRTYTSGIFPNGIEGLQMIQS